MGFIDDDDDVLPSPADSETFTSADHGRAKARKQRLKAEIGSRASEVREAQLQSDSDLKQLQQELSGVSEAKQQRRRDQQENVDKTDSAPKTKSLKEQEEQASQSAQQQQTPDTLLEQEARAKEVSDEESQTQPG